MSVALILAISAAIGLVSVFWGDIVAFINETVEKIIKSLFPVIIKIGVFLRKLSTGYLVISKYFSKKENREEFQQTTETKTYKSEELPDDLKEDYRAFQEQEKKKAGRSYLQNDEFDMTDRLEHVLTD